MQAQHVLRTLGHRGDHHQRRDTDDEHAASEQQCIGAAITVIRSFGVLDRLFIGINARLQRGIEIFHPFPVFSRYRERVTKTKAICLVNRILAHAPFGLVAKQNHIRTPPAQNVSNFGIKRRKARPGIQHEQAGICHVDAALCQLPHPSGQRVVRGTFEARRIDDLKFQVTKTPRTFAQIARDAGLVIDQGEFLADKAIEQS